jgi:hypothetical protein
MHVIKTLTFFLAAGVLASSAMAQTDEETTPPQSHRERMRMMRDSMKASIVPPPVGRWYFGGNFDGAIFSSAVFERPGVRRTATPVRFSAIGIGTNFNYDFDEHFGIFTGVGIKNIGFIEKIGDSTVKRRIYTAGIPIGVKLGNLQKRHYGFIGGGFDFPINYREKGFVDRGNKTKFNEFWSDRVEWYQPYLFAGAAFGSGMTLKAQYYPGNFFNTSYENTFNGAKQQPYKGWRAQIFYITLGMDIRHKTHMKKRHEEAPAEEEI